MLVGLLCFFAVGVALGLLGGGGSLLSVPVLVNIMGIPASIAVPMALPVVGIASATGAIERWRRGQLPFRTVLLFAVCAMAASYLAARLGVSIPDRPRLLLFGATMIVAAIAMWRRAATLLPHVAVPPRPVTHIVPVALVVGTLTGLLGVGGGFLIVPALVGVLGLAMPEATATSLAVIALNTLAAGAGFFSKHVEIDWHLTALVTAAAVTGMAGGTLLAPHLSTRTLSKTFAAGLLLLALFTIGKELLRG